MERFFSTILSLAKAALCAFQGGKRGLQEPCEKIPYIPPGVGKGRLTRFHVFFITKALVECIVCRFFLLTTCCVVVVIKYTHMLLFKTTLKHTCFCYSFVVFDLTFSGLGTSNPHPILDKILKILVRHLKWSEVEEFNSDVDIEPGST